MRNPFRRRHSRAESPRAVRCHGRADGSVHIQSVGKATTVTVICAWCVERWVVRHDRCPKCGSASFGTSWVRSGDAGYLVTFTCQSCGHGDKHQRFSG